ncbi:Titin [Fibrisoma limi BUZ 3]|uniref:Titin n=1 Tax=Fibrisoma limi BUZ 3 TaxID=1185876 RepID=I2GDW1_9BACT|nr:fibronectin type III domain-containing protein [Fibrisoma limi]CCH52085.1 Titin [Fibrisoma limi BUZ 3]
MKSIYMLCLLALCLLGHTATAQTPGTVAARTVNSTQICVTWTNTSPRVSANEIWRSTDNRNFTKIADVTASATEYCNTGLTPNTRYYYYVKALVPGTSGFASATVNAQTYATPPVVNDLKATVKNGNVIELSWTDVAKEGTYVVERRTGQSGRFERIATSGAGYTDRSVQPGVEYCYRVQYDASYEPAGYSTIVCATVPLAPTSIVNLKATALNSSAIQLTWNPFGKESSIFIERRLGQSGRWERIKDWLGDSGEYTDTGLPSNTEFCYRIGESGHEYSAIVCATTQQSIPNAPARLVASAVSATQINVQWADVSDNETGFELERAAQPGGPFEKIADLGVNTTSYEDKNRNASTQYCYRVRAKNAGGVSGFSNTDCAATQAPPVPPPAAPTGLSAVAVSSSQINLNWTDNAANETGYVVEQSLDGTSFTKIADLRPDVTTFQNTGLNSATRYVYRVYAVNAGGQSPVSNNAAATTFDVAPQAPARLTAQAVSFSQINLTWADLSGNETGFQLEQSTDGTTFTKITDLGPNTTSYQNTGLTGSTRYYYRVRAVNAIGPSGYSNVADATTPAAPVPPPAAPTGLTAVAVSSSQINVNWTDNATNESGFELEQSLDGTTFNKIADLAANTRSYQHTGLTPARKYVYRVRAINAGGQSAYSNLADATTFDVPPVAPARLTAQVISFNQINLQWADLSTNETGFQIEQSTDGVTFTKIADLGPNATSYQHTGLSGSTRYYYRVRAVNAIGPSGYSNVADATTLAPPVPDAPKNLQVEPLDFDRIRLTWEPLTGNPTGVIIERSTSPTAGFFEIGRQSAGPREFFDREILDYNTYYYRIKATNDAGSSPYSNVAKLDPDALITAVAPKIEPKRMVYAAERILYVQPGKLMPRGAAVRVMDARGTAVLNERIPAGSATGWQRDLRGLPVGLYVVLVELDGQRITQKIMIL